MAILLLIPFILGILELLRPKDASSHFINMDYSKEPRYFGRSFMAILKNAIPADTDVGLRDVKLSRNEMVEIAQTKKTNRGESYEHILYILGDLVTDERVRFNKEIYVRSDATIGYENVLRAIACDGRLSFSSGVTIIRWADAEGEVEISDRCNLGISVSSGCGLRIGKECRFRRLYGMPIMTYINKEDKPEASDESLHGNKDYLMISPFTKIEKDIIVKKGLIIKKDCTFMGSIKTYGNLILKGNATVFGNIFSEADIEIGRGTTVTGDIFSQGSVIIGQNVRIGDSGKVKSVIGEKGVILSDNVIIYGYVMTEGTGLVI